MLESMGLFRVIKYMYVQEMKKTFTNGPGNAFLEMLLSRKCQLGVHAYIRIYVHKYYTYAALSHML